MAPNRIQSNKKQNSSDVSQSSSQLNAKGGPASRLAPHQQMGSPVARLRLPDIQNRSINMPALVQQLNEYLNQEQQPDTELIHYVPIEEKSMLSEFQQIQLKTSRFTSQFHYIEFHLGRTLADFLIHLDQHRPPLPNALFTEARHLLDAQSQFYKDIQTRNTPLLTDSDYPILLKIMNATRLIAQELHQAPDEVIREAFLHFPPRRNAAIDELKCLDGILDRLETSLVDIRQHLRRLGLAPSLLLIHRINRLVQDPLQRMNNIMLKTCHETKLDETIPTGLEVHQIKALFLSLGIAPDTYEENNRFAEAVLNNTPGHLLFKTQQAFAQAMKNSLNTDLKLPESLENLQRHQLLLENITHQHLNQDTFSHRLKADGIPDDEIARFKDPLNYGLKRAKKMPIIDFFQEKNTSMLFEQEFGQWNDFGTELEDWDWQALNQKLDQYLTQENALTTEQTPLAQLSFEEIHTRTTHEYRNAALFGKSSQNEQWYAINYLLALLNGNSARMNVSASSRLICLHMLLSEFKPDKTTGKLKMSDFIINALSNYVQKNPEISSANQHLWHRLIHRISQVYSHSYPYNELAIEKILITFSRSKNKIPLNLYELTIIRDFMREPEYSLSGQLQAFLGQNPSKEILRTQLQPILSALLKYHDASIVTHLHAIFQQHQDLLMSLLIPTVEKLFNHTNLSSQIQYFQKVFADPDQLIRWFPQVLGANELHQVQPRAAAAITLVGMTQNMDQYLSCLIHSPVALENLRQTKFTSTPSPVLLNLQLPMPANAEYRRFLISRVIWPSHHYLGDNGTIRDSQYFKMIAATSNLQGFSQAYAHLTHEKPQWSQKLIAEFIVPHFMTATSQQNLVFFEHMCQMLMTSDRHLLGHYRSQFLLHALQKNLNQRQNFMLSIVRSLPDIAIKPIADFLFLQSMEPHERINPNNLINLGLAQAGADVQALIQKYANTFTDSEDYVSQIFYSVSLPHTDTQYAALLSPQTETHQYVMWLIESDPARFFRLMRIECFAQVCGYNYQHMMGQFLRLYATIPEYLKSLLRTQAKALNSDLISKIPLDIMSTLLN